MPSVDEKMMSQALELGTRGDPSPNPHVGALVAMGERVVGEGWHVAAGHEHAEVVSLQAAGVAARGKTMYVTLEPCNHEGRTLPCVDAILNAGIRRVVIGCRDPNPNVVGGGIEKLTEAGVEVVVGVLQQQAERLIRPWAKFITRNSAYVALKLAVSLDGRIATRSGASRWISCAESRAKVHALRARHDAVLLGVNTVIADDPLLTVRDTAGRSPIRVILDSHLRTPPNSKAVTTAQEVPTCIITTTEASLALGETLEAAGAAVIRVPATAEGRCDMRIALQELAAREVVSVLCEGGAELAGSLLANGHADEMHAFVAPLLLGPRGRPGAVDWAGPTSLEEAPRIDPPCWELCGSDAYVSGPLVYPKRRAAPTGG